MWVLYQPTCPACLTRGPTTLRSEGDGSIAELLCQPWELHCIAAETRNAGVTVVEVAGRTEKEGGRTRAAIALRHYRTEGSPPIATSAEEDGSYVHCRSWSRPHATVVEREGEAKRRSIVVALLCWCRSTPGTRTTTPLLKLFTAVVLPDSRTIAAGGLHRDTHLWLPELHLAADVGALLYWNGKTRLPARAVFQNCIAVSPHRPSFTIRPEESGFLRITQLAAVHVMCFEGDNRSTPGTRTTTPLLKLFTAVVLPDSRTIAAGGLHRDTHLWLPELHLAADVGALLYWNGKTRPVSVSLFLSSTLDSHLCCAHDNDGICNILTCLPPRGRGTGLEFSPDDILRRGSATLGWLPCAARSPRPLPSGRVGCPSARTETNTSSPPPFPPGAGPPGCSVGGTTMVQGTYAEIWLEELTLEGLCKEHALSVSVPTDGANDGFNRSGPP
nr:hypothetical protein Iba_chr14dCG3950 [Ipomoea batatas]